MKIMKKLFSILVLALVAMTASAKVDGYKLTVGTSEKGQLTFKVGDQTVTTAEGGKTVTVVAKPNDGYAASVVTAKAYTEWGQLKGRTRTGSIDLISDIEVTKTGINTFEFTMPEANVEVSAEYEYSAPVPAEEDKVDGKELDNVTVKMEIVDGTTPEVIDGVTHIKMVITGVEVPASGSLEEITLTIPSIITSADGSIVFEVTLITKDALKTPEGSNTVVTKVVLPETEKPIPIEDGAFVQPSGKPVDVMVPLSMLDDYALMPALKKNFEAEKISALVTAPNEYWTFSSGVDVELPVGINAYTCYIPNGVEVKIIQIPETLLKVDGKRVILANNGVLIGCVKEKGGDTYEVKAKPGHQLSGSTIDATTDAKSYGKDNWLVPVIKNKNYSAEEYLVLKDNEFHLMEVNDSETPACKALLKVPADIMEAFKKSIENE